MPKGGSRVRSGPDKDPNSGRSDRQRQAAKKAAASSTTSTGATASAEAAITNNEFDPMKLPGRGRTGRAPAFPLPKIVRFGVEISESGKPIRVADSSLSNEFRKRELQIWGELWKTPQAVAWERDSWRWPTIAKYCRIMASTEAEPDASASLLSRERELRIECGLTPDGLKINGWAIAPDELAKKRAAKKTPARKAAGAEYPPLRLQQ